MASRDLWTLQAEAVGGLLGAVDVPHDVVTDTERLSQVALGEESRDGETRRAHAPLIGIPVGSVDPPRPEATAAFMVFALAAIGALAISRSVPGPVKGAMFVGLVIVAGTLAYATWISSVAPLDLRGFFVDWRTSALAPVCGVALIFAYDLYPLPGSFVVKTFFLVGAVAAVAVFSTVRLAFVASGYVEFGAASFLGLHQLAGTFWDLAPGIAVLTVAHAMLPYTIRARRRWFLP